MEVLYHQPLDFQAIIGTYLERVMGCFLYCDHGAREVAQSLSVYYQSCEKNIALRVFSLLLAAPSQQPHWLGGPASLALPGCKGQPWNGQQTNDFASRLEHICQTSQSYTSENHSVVAKAIIYKGLWKIASSEFVLNELVASMAFHCTSR